MVVVVVMRFWWSVYIAKEKINLCYFYCTDLDVF